jgi:hypothetical protein
MKSKQVTIHSIIGGQSDLKRERLAEFFNTISCCQIQLSIRLSINSDKLWMPYLATYQDLFTSREEAERKSKTHSLMVMCINLSANYSTPYRVIFNQTMKELVESNFNTSKALLRLETEHDFIESINQFKKQSQQVYS